SAGVRSTEPPSATTIGARGNASLSGRTVSPITASSSRAATRTVRRSATRRRRHLRDGRNRGQYAPGGRVPEAVVPGLAAGEQEDEGGAAGGGVGRVGRPPV